MCYSGATPEVGTVSHVNRYAILTLPERNPQNPGKTPTNVRFGRYLSLPIPTLMERWPLIIHTRVLNRATYIDADLMIFVVYRIQQELDRIQSIYRERSSTSIQSQSRPPPSISSIHVSMQRFRGAGPIPGSRPFWSLVERDLYSGPPPRGAGPFLRETLRNPNPQRCNPGNPGKTRCLTTSSLSPSLSLYPMY